MKIELINLSVLLSLQIILKIVYASVIFEDCGSAYELYSVNIDGCGFGLPCYVTLGEDVPVKLQFHADFLSLKLDQNVVININHVNLRTPVKPELCDIMDCPVTTDYVTSFNSVMSVPNNMALNQRGFLKWSIHNEDELLCCVTKYWYKLKALFRNSYVEIFPVTSSADKQFDYLKYCNKI